MITFEEFRTEHLDACLEVMRSNMPTYFAEKEIPEFIRFLTDSNDEYEVVVLDGAVIGLGGIAVNRKKRERKAGLCYGIIHRKYHGMGYGKLLLKRRLEKIKSLGFVEKVTVETGQGTHGFFEKHGFHTIRIDKDPLGIGIDFYQMELELEKKP